MRPSEGDPVEGPGEAAVAQMLSYQNLYRAWRSLTIIPLTHEAFDALDVRVERGVGLTNIKMEGIWVLALHEDKAPFVMEDLSV